ncbi:MAG TPA: ABC transporter permease [Planctomycetota bacterium]|nr:ABC transporter permease [Planctomycetota bacterium]
MRTYLLKRLLLMIPTLFGITVITFTLIRLAPGDPTAPKVGEVGGGLNRAEFSREVQEAKKKLLGLDKPIPVQYVTWVTKLATFDLGESFSQKRPVGDLILESLSNTLKLDIIAIFLAYLIAVPLGIYSATHRYSLWDRVSTVALFILYSLPTFWIASLAIVFLGGGGGFADVFPIAWLGCTTPERHPFMGAQLDWAWHAFLPILCLTYPVLASLSRYSRAGMMDVVRQDFIRTARAKGLSENVVIFKHAARNGMIPILTLLATMLPLMVSGSVIIESIFSINGMGKLMFDAVMQRDYPIVMAVSSLSAIMTLFGILASDFLYVFVDPRISFEKLQA